MNSHKRDEYKRKLAEQKQEIAELKAHVERLRRNLIYRDRFVDEDHQELIETQLEATPAQSLQQIKRDAVLEAFDPVQSKFLKYVKAVEFPETQQKFVLMGAESFRNILKSYANNLVKDGE